MNRLKKNLLITIPIIIIAGIVVFYYCIGIGFGKAIPKAVKEVYKANKQWKAKNENPLDSIADNLIKIIDSTNLNNNKSHNDR